MFVGETDDSTQVPAPLRFLEIGLQLSQSRRRDSAKPGDCQRFRLKNNPNLLTTNNQKIERTCMGFRLFRYAMSLAASPPAHDHQGDADANQKHARPPSPRDLLAEKESPAQRAAGVTQSRDRNHQADVFHG